MPLNFFTLMACIFVIGCVLRLRRNTHWQEYASFDRMLSCTGLRHLGKGCIVRDTTSRRLETGPTALLSKLEYVVRIYSLLIATWPTARHWTDRIMPHNRKVLKYFLLQKLVLKFLASSVTLWPRARMEIGFALAGVL